ncbi:hypothetical protein [Neobacillus sp. D3-1R]|uniref:hypothetical protein n=1 Tax=Neobacillus sp. D3-1R TaxID=3445778 RepID=UPI003FA0FE74
MGPVERYLVRNDENQFIGSVSFRPYNYDSTIDHVFPFKQNEMIKNNIGSIAEIENLAILKEFRGLKNLVRVLLTVFEYIRTHNFKYYIATIDYGLFRAMNKFYPSAIYQLHKSIPYRKTNLVPIIIDVHHTLSNLDNYKWLSNYYQSSPLLTCSYCNKEVAKTERIAWSQKSTHKGIHNFNQVSCPNCLDLLIHNRNLTQPKVKNDLVFNGI